MDTVEILPLIWFAVIAFGVFMYVLLDGFVLGIGILCGVAYGEAERDIMMNSVAPIWDGNETWLVLGGVALLAAFPPAYTVLLPALYLPLTGMLIALIFRGVAFEFRFKARRKLGWNLAFNLGSVIATFFQGVTLGAIVQGIDANGAQYVGGAFDWFSGFTMLTGVALIAGYALLGATWVVMKTTGLLQDRAYGWSRALLTAVIVFMALVSVYVPFLDGDYAERWFGFPHALLLVPFPLLGVVVSYFLYRSVAERHEYWPFLLSLGMFAVGYGGLAASFWPHIIPPHLTIWNAASPPETQSFLIVGLVILLPFILFYTAWSYWIFRGKVGRDMGYH